MDENPVNPTNDGNLELPPDSSANIVAESPAPNKSTGRHLPPAIIALIVIALLALIGGGYMIAKKPAGKPAVSQITINTQSLDKGTLTKLTTQAGDNSKQQLVISPDTVFKNTVQIHDAVDTDKGLNVGGNLNVKGSTTLQGPAILDGNLAVRGSLSVSGALTAPSLNVGSLGLATLNASGNINFGGHLVPGGAVPTVKPSAGASGGTVSISGNDTAGTITITIGNDSPLAGEMAIINFHSPFTTTPKVQLTPINSAAAGLNYFATRTPNFFTINSASTPASAGSYVFDYLITN